MYEHNGCAPFHRVWEFKAVDPADMRRWICYGKGHDPPQPKPGTPAAEWMESTETELDRSLTPGVFLTRECARALAKLLRRMRRSEGFQVLQDRHFTPPKAWQPVTVNGVRYRSLRAAAEALGVGRWWLWDQFRKGLL